MEMEIIEPEKLKEKSTHPLIRFLKKFWSPIPWMIEIAAIISAIFRRWGIFFLILSMLLLIDVVSLWLEHTVDNAIAMLNTRLALFVWDYTIVAFLIPNFLKVWYYKTVNHRFNTATK
jgi:magnesium-transporting ATPase (P-type)